MPDQLDLSPLRAKLGTKPRMKYAQVRQAWPEIQQLRAEGHAVKDIWRLVCECGISIGYTRFAGYVRQLALERIAAGTPRPLSAPSTTGAADPLNAIREARRKPFFNPVPEEGLTR
jgi:hypothetical protein